MTTDASRFTVLLIRHVESWKNRTRAFSSSSDSETLTQEGAKEANQIADSLRKWLRAKSERTVEAIHCAESARSVMTAERIGAALGAPIRKYAALRSTFAGDLAGKTEEEARHSHPQYIQELTLYRHGLFNAYDLSVAKGKEDKRLFEQRVSKCLDRILAADSGSLKVVVTHRSPITALLMRYARALYGYPDNFFGYVKLDLGKACLLRGDSGGVARIAAVNIEVSLMDNIGYVR